MKAIFENIPLHKNEQDHRYELEYNGYTAFIDYKETSRQIALIHTEAPEALGGTGAAAALVEKTLYSIEQSGKKLLPFCPYVFAFIKRHPEWKKLVDPTFNGYQNL